jgi:hypothetical protein
MRRLIIILAFLLIENAARADTLNNLLDAQKVLDKEEVSVEYSEASSDELEGNPEAAKVHYRKISSYSIVKILKTQRASRQKYSLNGKVMLSG